MIRTTLVLLGLCAMVASGATDHTYISNQSSRNIRGSITYKFGNPEFIDRLILSKQYGSDAYSDDVCDFNSYISVTLWLDGAANSNWVQAECDQSVVGFDNSDGSGVDIYFSKYGNINDPVGNVLITIGP